MAQRSPASDTFSLLRSLFIFDPLICAYTAVLGAVSLISSLFDRHGRIQHRLARLWSWLILQTARCPVRVAGMADLDFKQPRVYAVNHISALDIPVVYTSLPVQFRILAKKELFRYPFLGWHLRRSGQIAIDQENPRSAIRSMGKAIATLEAGMPLVVFPEGGRSADGRLQPFQAGAFYAAIKAGVEVVPMAIAGTYEALPMNTFHIRPRPFALAVGAPIATTGMTTRDMAALAEQTRNQVLELYTRAAELAGLPPAADRQGAIAT